MWIGPTNDKEEECLNESCVGKVTWSDGTPFSYDGIDFTYQFNSGYKCIRFRPSGPYYDDKPCSESYMALCQITC